MARFDYLGKIDKKAAKKKYQKKSKGKEDSLESVYIRKETLKAVWREYRSGGESVSELVEDLLLKWLKERA